MTTDASCESVRRNARYQLFGQASNRTFVNEISVLECKISVITLGTRVVTFFGGKLVRALVAGIPRPECGPVTTVASVRLPRFSRALKGNSLARREPLALSPNSWSAATDVSKRLPKSDEDPGVGEGVGEDFCEEVRADHRPDNDEEKELEPLQGNTREIRGPHASLDRVSCPCRPSSQESPDCVGPCSWSRGSALRPVCT